MSGSLVMDATDWVKEESKDILLDLFARINRERINLAPNSILHIIIHKFDKIDQEFVDPDLFKQRVRMELQNFIFEKYKLVLDFDMIITSLYEQYRQRTFHSLFNILINSF